MNSMFMCTTHRIHWEDHREYDSKGEVIPSSISRCPLCPARELEDVKQEVAELREHRDLLLKAIDLKRTIERRKV